MSIQRAEGHIETVGFQEVPFISAIGGCPIRVAVEQSSHRTRRPTAVMRRISYRRHSSMERTRFRIETAIGTIMTAVAVFETQAEMKAEAIIRPSTICEGLVPTRRIVRECHRRCRLIFPVARPRITLPMTKKITVPAYGAATSSMVPMPNSGNSTNGATTLPGSVRLRSSTR